LPSTTIADASGAASGVCGTTGAVAVEGITVDLDADAGALGSAAAIGISSVNAARGPTGAAGTAAVIGHPATNAPMKREAPAPGSSGAGADARGGGWMGDPGPTRQNLLTGQCFRLATAASCGSLRYLRPSVAARAPGNLETERCTRSRVPSMSAHSGSDPPLFGLSTGHLRHPPRWGVQAFFVRFIVRASGPQTFADAGCEQDRYRT
jgi:hypothetical protein